MMKIMNLKINGLSSKVHIFSTVESRPSFTVNVCSTGAERKRERAAVTCDFEAWTLQAQVSDVCFEKPDSNLTSLDPPSNEHKLFINLKAVNAADRTFARDLKRFLTVPFAGIVTTVFDEVKGTPVRGIGTRTVYYGSLEYWYEKLSSLAHEFRVILEYEELERFVQWAE